MVPIRQNGQSSVTSKDEVQNGNQIQQLAKSVFADKATEVNKFRIKDRFSSIAWYTVFPINS